MENARQAYDAFNRLWAKVPRSVRVDRENHHLMLAIRAFFDAYIDTTKRAAIVESVTKPAVSDDGEPPDPVRQALRLLRTLDGREWEMVKAIVDLHKFNEDEFLDILDTIHDTHCPRCGEWLDDDDEHENCPVPVSSPNDRNEEPDVQAVSTAPTEASGSAPEASPVEQQLPRSAESESKGSLGGIE